MLLGQQKLASLGYWPWTNPVRTSKHHGQVEPREQVGRNIRRLREAANLSQMALGNRADMDMGEISRLERGLRDPRLSTMHRIAVALGVPIEELMEGISTDVE